MKRSWLVLALGLLAACGPWRPLPLAMPTPAVIMPDLRAGLCETWELHRAGRYEEAIPRLEYLHAHDDVLEDYYLYALGVAQARTGRRAAAETLQRLWHDHPGSVWRAAGALELGRLLLAENRSDLAEPHLTWASLAAGDPEIGGAALVERARLALGGGAAETALALLGEARRVGRGGDVAKQARRALQEVFDSRPDLAPRGEQWLAEARLLLEEGEYVEAEKAARAADPEGNDPEALLILADALKGQGMLAAASTALGALINRFPEHPAAGPAMFRMAKLYWNRDENVAAEAVFQEFLRRFGGDSSAPEALYAIGRIQQSTGRIAAAVVTYERLARRYPRAPLSWEARWRIGWIHYRNDRFAEAVRAFASLAGDTPDAATAAGARYWQARAAERVGRAAEARGLYRRLVRETPASYYAWRAEQRLGARAGGTGRDIPAPVPVPVPSPPAGIDGYHLSRYEALRAARLWSLAQRELAAIEQTDNGDAARRFLLAAYIAADAYPAARRLARAMGGAATVPEEIRRRLEYPLGFWPRLREEAERHSLDPLLLAAVIRQESQFDVEARSPAGARGLMQLLPATARQEAQTLGWRDDPSGRLYEPDVNLALGTQHLRGQLDRWNGDPIKALAAYNGGAAAVTKWQAQYGHLEPDEFVESITYRETREYVKRVLGHYRAYARLYTGGAS